MNGRRSQIVRRGMGVGQHPIFNHQEPSLERSIGGLLLQLGHHLRRTFYHHCLDGSTQFPPTIGQPERLAAGNWRGQVESAAKSGSVSNRRGIWTRCLKAEVGSVARSGTPNGISQLADSVVLVSCSLLKAGLRCTRV